MLMLRETGPSPIPLSALQTYSPLISRVTFFSSSTSPRNIRKNLIRQAESIKPVKETHPASPHLGCPVFATFFCIRFEAYLSEYGSYLLHIGMFSIFATPFILIIRFIFAPKYSHSFAYK
jgi:hypothetical protein